VSEKRCDMTAREAARRAHPQNPGRMIVALGRERLRVLNATQDVGYALVETFSSFRQADLTCGALEQANAETSFQMADSLAYDRRRQAQFAARCRHVAGCNDAREDFEVTDRYQLSPVKSVTFLGSIARSALVYNCMRSAGRLVKSPARRP